MKHLRLHYILIALNAILLALYAISWFQDPYLLFRPKTSVVEPIKNNYRERTVNVRKPLGDYLQFMSGNVIFSYGQQEEATVQKRRMIDDLEYIGSSRSPHGNRAFLRNTISKETYTISIGDSLSDYIVNEISSQSIILSKDGEQFELRR